MPAKLRSQRSAHRHIKKLLKKVIISADAMLLRCCALAGVSSLEREDAEDEGGRRYAMMVADTVVAKAGGAPPDVCTVSTPKDWKEVAYYLKVGRTKEMRDERARAVKGA